MGAKLTAKKANIFLVITIVFYFAMNYLTSYLGDYFGMDFRKNNFYLFILLNQIVGLLIPILIFSSIMKLPIGKTYRLNNLKISHIVLIIIMSPLVVLLTSAINGVWNYLLGFDISTIQNDIPIPGSNNELLIAVIIIGLTPAICEEMLCRGVVLRGYERFGTTRAIIFSGLLFSIIHFDLRILAGIFFMGMILGYYTARTNSLYAGILAHFLNNALASVQRYFFKNLNMEAAAVLDKKAFISMLIMGVVIGVIFIPILTIFWHFTKSSANKNYILLQKNSHMLRAIFHWPIILLFLLYVVYQILFVF